LETTRARTIMAEKMQAGNFMMNLKKKKIKIGLEIEIINIGCWPHFDNFVVAFTVSKI
jgi:hypothetical protein